MSGVSFLIREMHKRGLRIRSGPFAQWVDGEFQVSPGQPEGAYLLCNEFKDGTRGVPGMWWLIEAREENSDRLHETTQDTASEYIWTKNWEAAAGSLVEAINSMHWVFEFVIFGEIKAPRHEWLCCDACDEAQGCPKAYGAPSQKRKCHMTPYCTGTLRRLPDIWAIDHPKPRPKPKAPRAPRTPGAARVRKKLHLDEESADTLAA